MSSEMFVDHAWLASDDIATGVQIVEIKSSESDKTVDDDKDYSDHNSRSYLGGYRANEAARERRRLKNMNHTNYTTNDTATNTDPETYYDNIIYRDVYHMSGRSNTQKENVIYNHQMNCFTILDNHLMSSETTSDDDFADIEFINCGDPVDAWNYDENYNSDADEKRTVWIYSFKNRRILSENDYELVNIPSQEASETNSSVDYRAPRECHRAATPIAPPHVPRLHIPTSPTLPTVTEMKETGKLSSSNQTSKRSNYEHGGVKQNNWFMSEHVTPNADKGFKSDKGTSIVNWMALSPREKRRRFRNASPLLLPKELISPLPTLNEVSSCTDNIEEQRSGEVIPEVRDGSWTDDKLQNSERTSRSVLEQIGNAIDTDRKSIKTFRTGISTPKDRGMPSDRAPQDRGDHYKSDSEVPRIRIKPRVIRRPVSDPIEKLNSKEWIHEDKLEDGYVLARHPRGDGAADALLKRNMALLKPAAWAEYLAATESIPSINISINTDSDDDRQPWYRRIAKYLNCCK